MGKVINFEKNLPIHIRFTDAYYDHQNSLVLTVSFRDRDYSLDDETSIIRYLTSSLDNHPGFICPIQSTSNISLSDTIDEFIEEANSNYLINENKKIPETELSIFNLRKENNIMGCYLKNDSEPAFAILKRSITAKNILMYSFYKTLFEIFGYPSDLVINQDGEMQDSQPNYLRIIQ